MISLFKKIWLLPALLLCGLAFGQTTSGKSIVVGDAATPAFEFQISDIRINGLRRIKPPAVFSMLTVTAGDVVDELSIRSQMRILFASSQFSDVHMARDGNELIIEVVENPAISSIEISGNKAIQTDGLLDGLKQSGIAEGEVFRRSVLANLKSELQRLYIAQGRYGVVIETKAVALPLNQVGIELEIEEGVVSRIAEINLIGNETFSAQELLGLFELKPVDRGGVFGRNSKYSREKLRGDLERMESYCQDRGYVNFEIISTQVTVSKDKQEIYISINVKEGSQFTVSGVNLIGEIGGLPADVLERLLIVEPNTTFSRTLITSSQERLVDALSEAGYSQAEVNSEPVIDEENGTVEILFQVNVGQRTYIRRINFYGNTVTRDEVLRREMRQLEGSWVSSSQMETSKLRLERLGFFSEVAMETVPVPGVDDQVDLHLTVKEQPSGSISASIGYARGSGAILSGSLQENNLFGGGNTLNTTISRSEYQSSLNVSYINPYVSTEGISRSLSVYTTETNYDALNISRYSTTNYGLGTSFGFPLRETEQMRVGISVDYTDIKNAPTSRELEYEDFFAQEGREHLNYKMDVIWSGSRLNRGLFPTAGRSQSLNLEFSTPGSDLQFYKLSYFGQVYKKLSDSFSLRFRTRAGFSDVYGDSSRLPLYENFFAGGFGSVRGYKTNTLGSRASVILTERPRTAEDPEDPEDPEGVRPIRTYGIGNSLGGNILFEAGAELIFKLPFVENNSSVRSLLFIDAGQVYNTNCPSESLYCQELDAGEIRFALGASLVWLSPLGPLSFSYSIPFNHDSLDRQEAFQFEIGGRIH